MNVKIAIISTVGLNYDGITNVITSYLQAMDLTDLDIYVIGTIAVHTNIREKIEKLGCCVVEAPNRKTDTLKYAWFLMNFIRKHKIQVIHAHGNSGTLAVEMVAAYLGGCKKRIAHSHNTRCNQIKSDKLLRPIFNVFYTDALACGKAAGEFLFPKRDFTVLKNGRDVTLYSYNALKRKSIQEKYGIRDELVIGHIGGFVSQKNHEFVLRIYKSVLKLETNVRFFLIGDGLLKEKMVKEAQELGIRDIVEFTGNVDNINEFLSAMDGMVLPSKFEGLPLVVIEWQINGLPCLISDTVTKDCAITSLVQFESLNSDPEIWAKKILEMIKENKRNESAENAIKEIYKAGFDINSSAKQLRELYMKN